jgi:uncharacterized membrane protein (DUF373 family)
MENKTIMQIFFSGVVVYVLYAFHVYQPWYLNTEKEKHKRKDDFQKVSYFITGLATVIVVLGISYKIYESRKSKKVTGQSVKSPLIKAGSVPLKGG